MRIGIDVTASIYSGTGVASYYRSLVPELIKQGKDCDFVLLGYAMRQYSDLKLANKKFFLPPRLMEILWNKLHVVPVENFTGDLDVFHAWDYLQPPVRKAKIVTTIHDLTTLKFPLYHHVSTVEAQRDRLRWVRREADLILADSLATKQDIIELLGVPEKKIKVVYLAAGEQYEKFSRKAGSGSAGKVQEIKRIKTKYGIGGEYFISVGTLEPRKNLKRVIEAFSGVRSQESGVRNLVVVGKFGWGENLPKVNNVNLLGLVEDNDLPGLYAGSAGLIYPSLYEGFGLPVLEAMTVGCPVLTSDRGSLGEVAGDAAVLVDPENIESIVWGIESLIKDREKLIGKGLKRSENFSWEKTAAETLSIYKSLC
ncbi:glycosyltransferase family 4 protein [Candidatus Collierbacteria bacterium]|nr:glycosyltransferase family 4 protein [Candidatus Collierbacteria bacterium]